MRGPTSLESRWINSPLWAPGLDVVDDGRGVRRRARSAGSGSGARHDGSEPAQVIGDPALDARSPLWTPDGETIIFAGSEGNGGLRHLSDGR